MGISIPTEPVGWFMVVLNILSLITAIILPLTGSDLSLGKFSEGGIRHKQLPKCLQWCHQEYSYKLQWLMQYAVCGITYVVMSLITTEILHDDYKWYHQYPLYFWASLFTFTAHQIKRCVEVLCIHQYSHNTMHLGTGVLMSNASFIRGLTLSYGNITNNLPAQQLNNALIIYIGLTVWVIGEIGNTSCHAYLAWKRKSIDDNGYIPLRYLPLIFRVLIVPNMAFELVLWSGYCIIMRELNSLITLATMTWYVGVRVYMAHDWYASHPDGTVNADALEEDEDVIGALDFDNTARRKDTVSLHTSRQSIMIVQ